MTLSRIYMPAQMEVGDRCEVRGEQKRYVASVLRMRKGDLLLLFDGQGCKYEAVIAESGQKSLTIEIVKKEVINAVKNRVTLAQSLPKGRKMDFIVEKACELGVTTIIPFLSKRSIPHPDFPNRIKKTDRWKKIACESVRTCHAPSIPVVLDISTLNEVLCLAGTGTHNIIFWEEERRNHLRDILRNQVHGAHGGYFLVVGPEGGFSTEEIELAHSMGFISASLGRQILKVETAAIAILSIIQYECGAFGEQGEEER